MHFSNLPLLVSSKKMDDNLESPSHALFLAEITVTNQKASRDLKYRQKLFSGWYSFAKPEVQYCLYKASKQRQKYALNASDILDPNRIF